MKGHTLQPACNAGHRFVRTAPTTSALASRDRAWMPMHAEMLIGNATAMSTPVLNTTVGRAVDGKTRAHVVVTPCMTGANHKAP